MITFIIITILTFLVVTVNAIHALIALILLFLNFTIILFQIEVPFLGFAYLLVYIGALSVLFLFIILLINLRIISILRRWNLFLLLISILGFILVKAFIQIKIPSATSTLIFTPFFDIHIFGSYLFVTHPLYMFLSLFILFLALFLVLFLSFKQTTHIYSFTIFGIFIPDWEIYLMLIIITIQLLRGSFILFKAFRKTMNEHNDIEEKIIDQLKKDFQSYYDIELNLALRFNSNPDSEIIRKRAMIRQFVMIVQTYKNYLYEPEHNKWGKFIYKEEYSNLTLEEFELMLEEAFNNINQNNKKNKKPDSKDSTNSSIYKYLIIFTIVYFTILLSKAKRYFINSTINENPHSSTDNTNYKDPQDPIKNAADKAQDNDRSRDHYKLSDFKLNSLWRCTLALLVLLSIFARYQPMFGILISTTTSIMYLFLLLPFKNLLPWQKAFSLSVLKILFHSGVLTYLSKVFIIIFGVDPKLFTFLLTSSSLFILFMNIFSKYMIGVPIEGLLALGYIVLLFLLTFTCYFRLLAGFAFTFTYMAIRLKPEWISNEIYFMVTGNESPNVTPPGETHSGGNPDETPSGKSSTGGNSGGSTPNPEKPQSTGGNQNFWSNWNPLKIIPKNVSGMSSKVQIGVACATCVGGLAAAYIASIALDEQRQQTEEQRKQTEEQRKQTEEQRKQTQIAQEQLDLNKEKAIQDAEHNRIIQDQKLVKRGFLTKEQFHKNHPQLKSTESSKSKGLLWWLYK